ncbi:MAG TPA: class I SAM-dependent methyltransferase [Chitinophagales bacterium]|nr:class I SAM-dependent methyltransferase [Chitinophagales bacterium]
MAPNFLQKAIISLANKFDGARRLNEEAAIPYYELSTENISNLKVLLNREQLLQHLPHNGVVAEAGVYRGDFSEQILAITQPAKLHLINNWGLTDMAGNEIDFVKQRFAGSIANNKVVLHNGTSVNMLAQFGDAYFDWVYLDTDHSYANTRAELELLALKVKQQGIIAGHDYTHSSYKSNLKYGVIEAVNEFCLHRRWEFLFLTFETYGHYSFAIRKIQ